jgi:hypothetical protein
MSADSLLRFISVATAAGLLASCLATTQASPPSQDPPSAERLYYELEVSLAGTRSQGVRGRLFDPSGRSVAVSPAGAVIAESDASGGVLLTNAGAFAQRPRVHLWDVSGMINLALLPPQQINNPAVDGPTLFRLFVSAECSRSEGWRGELSAAPGAPPVPPSNEPIETPMGRFSYRSSPHPWGQEGWFPEAWPPPEPGRGRWPCAN